MPINGACTDDGNPCTDDVCNGGNCLHPPKADCADCGTPNVCIQGACTPSNCDLDLTPGSATMVAGGFVDLVLDVGCDPDCGPAVWLIDGDPAYVESITPDSGSTACPSGSVNVKVKLRCDAPTGDVVITATGIGPGGVVCGEGSSTITIVAGPDLDVDSNNDGSIDASDDAIEDDAFSASTPGKYGWTNNDDSDGNGTSDNGAGDAGQINGAADLAQDLAELKIRGMDSAYVPVGAKLYLESSAPDVVRVFGCYTETCADVLLGPGLPAKTEIPFDAADRRFAVEGVQDGLTLTLDLILEDAAGQELCRDTVRVTVIRLDVAWVHNTAGTPPITDVNDHPTAPIGLKYYPGATAPGGGWNDGVKVQVTTVPTVDNVKLYFAAFDPDDPSADADAVDNNLTGGDNRDTSMPGNQRLASTQKATNASGIAKVGFTVAHQPGDNHRVAATMKQFAIVDTLNNDNIPPSGQAVNKDDGQVDTFIGTLSPLLTVWRWLHVETDSMVRPTFVQNTWSSTWSNPTAPVTDPYAGLPSPPWYEIKVADPAGGSATGQFNSGVIELNGTATSRIFDYFSTVGDDEVIVQFPGGMGGLAAGSCVISDDDLGDLVVFGAMIHGCDDGYTNGVDLLPPDVSALTLRYRPAYIDPVHETALSATGGITTFIVNQEFGLLGDYGRDLWDQVKAPGVRQLPISTPQSWTVMVASAWQAETDQDADPDSEQLTNGIGTHGSSGTTEAIGALGSSYTGNCAVFKALMIGESDIPERFTVAHEIAHTLGLPHSSTGLMFAAETVGAPAQQSLPFSADSLVLLRVYSGP